MGSGYKRSSCSSPATNSRRQWIAVALRNVFDEHLDEFALPVIDMEMPSKLVLVVWTGATEWAVVVVGAHGSFYSSSLLYIVLLLVCLELLEGHDTHSHEIVQARLVLVGVVFGFCLVCCRAVCRRVSGIVVCFGCCIKKRSLLGVRFLLWW